MIKFERNFVIFVNFVNFVKYLLAWQILLFLIFYFLFNAQVQLSDQSE